jgi:DNA-binding HxlR family transcriptional regulator
MAVANTVVPDPAPCELGRKAMIEVLARVGDKWTILIWSARLEMCQWRRETLDKESVWDGVRSISQSR